MAELRKKSGLVGELSAEFAGTMILILFGCGVVAQVVAGGALTDPAGGLGDHDSIAWAWGLGVTLGVYVAARLSGAHINPAVTLALAAFKGVPVEQGGTLRAGADGRCVRGRADRPLELQRGAGEGRPRTHHQDAGSLLHPARQRQPGPAGARVGAFRDQIIGTAILLLLVLAVTDLLNTPPGSNMGPFIIGLIVVAIGMALGNERRVRDQPGP